MSVCVLLHSLEEVLQSLLLVSHHEKTILPSQEAVLYWKEGVLFYLENYKLHSRSLQGVLQFELAEEQSLSISSITLILKRRSITFSSKITLHITLCIEAVLQFALAI